MIEAGTLLRKIVKVRIAEIEGEAAKGHSKSAKA